MNILKEADKLLNSNEGKRIEMYGSIQSNFSDAAKIASIMSDAPVSISDMYISLIALKFARESHRHKEDNLLDVVAYIAAWNDYEEELKNKPKRTYSCVICGAISPRGLKIIHLLKCTVKI